MNANNALRSSYPDMDHSCHDSDAIMNDKNESPTVQVIDLDDLEVGKVLWWTSSKYDV